MKKAIIISAFLSVLIPTGSTSHQMLEVFDAPSVSTIIEYKSSANSSLRKSLKDKAELYLRIVQKTLVLITLEKDKEERERMKEDVWLYQHRGYQCWLAAQGNKNDIDFYWKHLVPRAI